MTPTLAHGAANTNSDAGGEAGGTNPGLRLLYVQPAEVFGGAERQGVLHISRLPFHGIEVIPVVGPGTAIRAALADVGVSDYVFFERLCHEPYYPVEGLSGSLAFAARFVRDWFATQHTLLGLARRHRIDLMIANRAVGWIAASTVARVLGIPIVWRGGGRITQVAETQAIRVLSPVFRPALFLANCEIIRSELTPLIGSPSGILHNGVDTDRFNPRRVPRDVRAELGLGADVPVVGMSARPAPEKGMERLLRIVQETARRIPAVRFLLAGEYGFRKRYEESFAAAGVGERVRFLGHLQDVPSFLAACDTVILTSNAHSIEGSPNALLEAMAMARPVVATRVGGVPEAVTHGVEGFLFPEDDVTGFAEHLTRLLRDEPLRARMGAAGRVRILTDYHSEKVVAHLAQTLRTVHARHVHEAGKRKD